MKNEKYFESFIIFLFGSIIPIYFLANISWVDIFMPIEISKSEYNYLLKECLIEDIEPFYSDKKITRKEFYELS